MRDVELGDEGVVFVRESGDDAVALPTELVVGLEYVGVFVEVDLFVGAHGDIGVGSVFVVILNDVNILDTEAVAAAQDGTGVVGLEDVFEDDAYMACAVEDEFVE